MRNIPWNSKIENLQIEGSPRVKTAMRQCVHRRPARTQQVETGSICSEGDREEAVGGDQWNSLAEAFLLYFWVIGGRQKREVCVVQWNKKGGKTHRVKNADGKGSSSFHLSLAKNGKEKVQRGVGGLEKGQWANDVLSTDRQYQEVSAPFT